MVRPDALHEADSSPSRRVVLLGASNLIRGVSTVIGTAQNAWGRPLDILTAMGHGRSYGMTSWVLGRSLPSITDCGLWDDLASRAVLPTASLLTDVGNDILYGASVERIAAWVEGCLERLAPMSSKILVTQLPLASIARLGNAKYLLLRTILFPRSQLQLATARMRSEQLNERVVALARNFGAVLVEPDSGWYGFDPIHIRRFHQAAAWRQILSGWQEDGVIDHVRPSLRRWSSLLSCRPLERGLFGIQQHQPQPSVRLVDGSRVSFY